MPLPPGSRETGRRHVGAALPDSPRSVHTSLRSALPVLLAGLALALSACQDPSGVGLSLIGDETSDPNSRLFPADSVFFTERDRSTSGFANGSGTPIQTRLLVGEASDPLLGDVRSEAYLDVRGVARPSGFSDRAIEQVQIQLVKAFAYGDTTATLPIEIRQVTSNWAPEGLPIDTTLATGDVITSGTISAMDSLTTLDLPEEYINANTVLLRDSVDVLFEGFKIEVPEGFGPMPGAVVGFNGATSFVRLIGAEYTNDDDELDRDTVDYPLVEIFSSLTRGDLDAPEDRLLLRDGTPSTLSLAFDYSSLEGVPLANAGIRVPIDRDLLASTPGFFRPVTTNITLFGVLADSARIAIAERVIEPDADEVIFRDTGLTNVFQDLLLGGETFIGFEIGSPVNTLGLSTLPVVYEEDVPGELRRPRLSLVIIGGPA